MLYQDQLKAIMEQLAQDERTVFIGQGVKYKQHGIYYQLKDIPDHKKIELPVAEELQMGITLGLANEGLIPISIYPRFDFVLLAMNQLINHIDKWPILTKGKDIRAIIKVAVGSSNPLNPGLQHSQNYTYEIQEMAYSIVVHNCNQTIFCKKVSDIYLDILEKKGLKLIIEYPDLYTKEV